MSLTSESTEREENYAREKINESDGRHTGECKRDMIVRDTSKGEKERGDGERSEKRARLWSLIVYMLKDCKFVSF